MKFLETGKLKCDFLEDLLGKIEIEDERVVVGPGIGEDAAVLDMGHNYLIVKSDPITFVSDRIGWYVVNVNANDIASMGGKPRWFLVTVLLPENRTTGSLIEKMMKDLRRSCDDLGIALIGGHTEVTHGLKNPVLSGTMLGEADKGDLIKNGGIKKGDLLYMTKAVAIEATSIIAREKKDQIVSRFGMKFYMRCLDYLDDPGISVVGDAEIARKAAKVSGMHDPTEGGILTGAYEMARGSGVGLDLYIEKVPVYEETARLCELFSISPYGSIASGSLLIAVSKEEGGPLERAFNTGAGSVPRLSVIGEFTEEGGKVHVVEQGSRKLITPTGKDEITKLL
jgi:hydrogenase expression/formation protein HypE